MGDPVFDQFFASVVDSVQTQTEWSERHTKSAPAGRCSIASARPILITHSQGGAFGWQLADARPGMVKGIIAVEPALSPTTLESSSEPPLYGHFDDAHYVRFRPVTDAAQIVRDPQAAPDRPDVVTCWLQKPPVRTLPTLKGIPIMVVASQASPNSKKHYCVSRYLTQAGVANDYVPLESVGVLGNAHMMMLEKNSDAIAAFFAAWLTKRHL